MDQPLSQSPALSSTSKPKKISGLWMAIPAFFTMLLLVWVDKDTRGIEDLWNWRILNGMLFYFFPIWLGTALFLRLLQKYFRPLFSLLSAVFVGVPLITFLFIAFWFGLMKILA